MPQPPAAHEPAIVAVSGGMDSLLALALLAQQGQALAAVHGRFLQQDPGRQRRLDALQQICRRLDVPLLDLDLRQPFLHHVQQPFVADYLQGRTPNPCALCNPRIKFGLLFQEAAQRLKTPQACFATGHYARIASHPVWGAMLARGADPAKDQSYFLALLPHEILPRLRFPLATQLKKHAPALLRDMGLQPPEKGESQEVCFIPDNDYRAFLQRHARAHDLRLPGPGPVLLPNGTRIATHHGLWRYTQGQRRGLGIPWRHPLYVLDKDTKANALIVGSAQDRREAAAAGCLLLQPTLHAPLDQWPQTVLAQVRYRQKPRPVCITPHPRGLELRFRDPEAEAADGPPAPGQLGVCYDQDGLVLAGGIIAPQGAETPHGSAD